MVKIDIGNRVFALVVFVVALLGVAGVVYAYGSGDPTIHGHDDGEVEGTVATFNVPVATLKTYHPNADCNFPVNDWTLYYSSACNRYCIDNSFVAGGVIELDCGGMTSTCFCIS